MSVSGKFFLTGLPRCRSAWFANLLTYGNSVCIHDGLVGLDKISDLRGRIEEIDSSVSGVSDPALLFCWQEVAQWYPEAKWVVVDRDFDAVVKSCQKFSVARSSLSRLLYRLEHLKANLSPIVIRFEEIGLDSVRRLEDHLGVNCGPQERIRMLLGMNVQADPVSLSENIKTIMLHPPRWLKEAA